MIKKINWRPSIDLGLVFLLLSYLPLSSAFETSFFEVDLSIDVGSPSASGFPSLIKLPVTVENLGPNDNENTFLLIDLSAQNHYVYNSKSCNFETGRFVICEFGIEVGESYTVDIFLEQSFCAPSAPIFGQVLTLSSYDNNSTNNTGNSVIEYPDIISLGNMDFADRSTVYSSILSGENLTIGADAHVHSSVKSNQNVFLRERAWIDASLFLNGALTTQNHTVITGTVYEDSPTPLPVIINENIQYGSQNFTIKNDEEGVIPPGAYNHVTIRARSKAVFTSGDYHIQSLNIEPNTEVLIDTLTAPVHIYVENHLMIGDRASLQRINDNMLIWYSHAPHVSIGTDTNFIGTLVAPQSSLRVGSRTAFNGCATVNHFRAEPDSYFGQELPGT